MRVFLVILTGNQKIHPGLSDPLGPMGDLFYHGLEGKRTKIIKNVIKIIRLLCSKLYFLVIFDTQIQTCGVTLKKKHKLVLM